MTKTTVFKVGSAERLADGSVRHYNQGRTEYPNLEAVRRYIQNLRHSYRERGTVIQADEFVPIEITTTIHDP